MKRFLQHLNANKIFLVLTAIFVLGAFLRLYRLTDTLDFNGDLGRDALIAKRIWVDRRLTLIGPRASGGDFFLGPFYYYFIIPSLIIFNFSALGPVYWTIFFNLLTVILVFIVASDFFEKKTGLIAAALYATSPLVVRYSRVSGNYATLPFFSLLGIYLFWHWLKERKGVWLVGAAFLFGLAVQLHYSAVVLLGFGFLCLLIYRLNPFRYARQFMAASLVFAGLNLPLLFFDLRHHWINTQGIFNYLTKGSGDNVRQIIGLPPWSLASSFRYFSQVLASVVSPFLTNYWVLFWALTIVVLGFLALKQKIKKELAFLSFLTAFTVIFSSFYKGYFVDYYLAFIFALPIMIIAYFLSVLAVGKGRFLLLGSLLVYLFIISRQNLAIQPIGRNFGDVLSAGEIIGREAKTGERFNIFLLRPEPFWSTAAEYRYLVEKQGPVALEPTAYREADILYFVDETKKANPLKTLNWEVTEFGPKRIIDKWEVGKIIIYKLGR